MGNRKCPLLYRDKHYRCDPHRRSRFPKCQCRRKIDCRTKCAIYWGRSVRQHNNLHRRHFFGESDDLQYPNSQFRSSQQHTSRANRIYKQFDRQHRQYNHQHRPKPFREFSQRPTIPPSERSDRLNPLYDVGLYRVCQWRPDQHGHSAYHIPHSEFQHPILCAGSGTSDGIYRRV